MENHTPENTSASRTEKPEWAPSSKMQPQQKDTSMLASLLIDSERPENTPQITEWVNTTEIITKRPMDAVTFFRLLGAIFFTALIFFGSFLAYIVFNPDKAQFFLLFGIEMQDVKMLLANLVNGIFSTVVVLISILFVFLVFRAIWTPKIMAKKKTISTIGAIFSGFILFSLIGIWSVLIGRINATDYANLEGSIILYDNDLRKSSTFQNQSQITDTNIIWPITIWFDISTNAKKIAESRAIEISWYDIDFDGAKCTSGTSKVTGKDPDDPVIICTFDSIKNYRPIWVYKWIDKLTRSPINVDMEFPTIQIVWVVEKIDTKNIEGKRIYTLDASALQSLGTPTWIIGDGTDPERPFVGGTLKSSPSITENVERQQRFFCLTFDGGNSCRIFVIEDAVNTNKNAFIREARDPWNPLKYTFTLTGLTTNLNEITDIAWIMNNTSTICNNRDDFTCEHTFSTYGTYTITASITWVWWIKEEFRKENLRVEEPTELLKHIKVISQEWKLLNPESTYDRTAWAYMISGLKLPTEVSLDARDVIPASQWYSLDSVEWTIMVNGRAPEIRNGENTTLELTQEGRYEVIGTYTFTRKNGSTQNMEEKKGTDRMIFTIAKSDIRPILNIAEHSDYVPVTIEFDASASESKYGEITKFIFDFGEGKPPVQWDAQPNYRYITAWAKDVTLTVVTEYGETASITRTIILKEQPKSVILTPSIDQGIVGKPVDWSSRWTVWEIEQTVWNFWDNTSPSYEQNPTHTYTTPWTFTTTLTVIFTDGTTESMTRAFTVKSNE